MLDRPDKTTKLLAALKAAVPSPATANGLARVSRCHSSIIPRASYSKNAMHQEAPD